MLPKHQILKPFSDFHLPSIHTHNLKWLPQFFSCPLSTIREPSTSDDSPPATESPQIPSWVTELQSDSAEPDDDFVIPSVAGWVENFAKEFDGHRKVKGFLKDELDTDVYKVTKILRQRYPSYEDVVQALGGCGVCAYNSLIGRLLERFSNDWISAFGVFSWAKSQTGYTHTTDLCNAMVDILGKSRKFAAMWDLVEEMNKTEGYVTLDTMAKVMRRLARTGNFGEAIGAFRDIERFGVAQDSSALNILMDALVKQRSVESAYEVFTELKERIPGNLHSFNILIHGFCKIRKFEDARKIMEEMEKNGCNPDVVSYTSFIEAYCRDKDFRKVNAILDEMQEKGCKPSVTTYTIIMHARGKAGEISEALEVYEKMKRSGCLPDSSFYGSLIYILTKTGRLKDADEVFNDMDKQGLKPDVLTYSTMISSACAHSQEEKAFKLLRQMEEDSCKPNLKTYTPLLKMCCRKKRMKMLNFLLRHMLENDVSIDAGTYSYLVRKLCRNGKLGQACLIFEEMVLKGMTPKDSTYKMLVEGLENKGMVEAKERIQQLMSKAKRLA